MSIHKTSLKNPKYVEAAAEKLFTRILEQKIDGAIILLNLPERLHKNKKTFNVGFGSIGIPAKTRGKIIKIYEKNGWRVKFFDEGRRVRLS